MLQSSEKDLMLIDGGIDRTFFCLLLFGANVGDVEIGFLQVSQYILFRRFILIDSSA